MPNDLILSVTVGLSASVQSVFALSFAASAGVAAVILISSEPGNVAAAAILMSVMLLDTKASLTFCAICVGTSFLFTPEMLILFIRTVICLSCISVLGCGIIMPPATRVFVVRGTPPATDAQLLPEDVDATDEAGPDAIYRLILSQVLSSEVMKRIQWC